MAMKRDTNIDATNIAAPSPTAMRAKSVCQWLKNQKRKRY